MSENTKSPPESADALTFCIAPILQVAPVHQSEAFHVARKLQQALAPRLAAIAARLPQAHVQRTFDLTRSAPTPGAGTDSPSLKAPDGCDVTFAPRGRYTIEMAEAMLEGAADVYGAVLEGLAEELASGDGASHPPVCVRIDLSQLVIDDGDELDDSDMTEAAEVPRTRAAPPPLPRMSSPLTSKDTRMS